MTPIRVMELRGTHGGGGGPDKTILLSAVNHNIDHFYILIAYLRNPKDQNFRISSMAAQHGIDSYIEISDRSMIDLRCLATLNNLIKKHKIDLVHVHDIKTTLLGLMLKVLNPRLKLMHTAHGWIVHSKLDSIKQKVQFLLLRAYPLHLAVSRATRDFMIRNRISPKKIEVLYNCIATDYWNSGNGDSAIREEFGISPDTFLIGTVGRLSAEKGLPDFFQVAQRVLSAHSNTHFLVVGDGSPRLTTELQNIVRTLSIEHAVTFAGHRTDLRSFYSSFDLFLATSLTEGLPNTILEAMAMETPVVATRVGGIPEIIVDKKTGLLSEPRDVDGLSSQVLFMLHNPAIRRDLSMNARKTVLRQVSFQDRLDMIENLYRNLVVAN
jgi:glycosyltransferase involved in cell wall biosynthesis